MVSGFLCQWSVSVPLAAETCKLFSRAADFGLLLETFVSFGNDEKMLYIVWFIDLLLSV